MDTAGRATAITVISVARRSWGLFLTLNWARISLMRRLKGPSMTERSLQELAFIGVAHWALLRRIPANGRRWRARRLRKPYVLFQSNFYGSGNQYIEGFSLVIPLGVWATWGGAYGVPRPLPVAPFQGYIEEHRIPSDQYHYYCAYPEASTKMIRAALELKREFDAFAPRASELEPEEFAAEYRALLTRTQTLL
jgi:hypothetical protein